MTFGQLFSVLRARWWLALLVLILTVGVTVAVSLILPKQYEASASVFIDVKPDPVSAMMFSGMVSPAFMATQVDIIRSDRVSGRVVRNLRLAENADVRTRWLESTGGVGSFEVWLSDLLQRNMQVKPSLTSNIITISYKAPNPNFAAAIANAFVKAYIETALELRVDPAKNYSNFFEQRANEARDALEKAQARLSAFQREKGIIATDERVDVENARLNELSSQLVAVQAIAVESSTRKTQAQGVSADKMQEVLGNAVISGLKADLSRQEARLKEIGSKYGDAHPQVIELKASISELRVKIAEETSRVTNGVGVTSTINSARESQLRAALEAQRSKVLRMKQVRDEGLVLMREVENAQRSYDLVLTRQNQTSLESQTTQSNVFALTSAVAPVEHSSPNLGLNAVLATVLGLVLGIGSCLLLELIDRRVRTVDDVVQAVDLPVIGTMPKPNAKRYVAKHGGLLPMQRRPMGLPSPVKEV